eukprot:COSAG05_NODE_9308_length_633_cov_0.636704_1_plen_181_part_10
MIITGGMSVDESDAKKLGDTDSIMGSSNMTSDAATASAMVTMLRPILEAPLAQRFGLNWRSVHPHLAKLCSPEQLQAGLEDPGAFIKLLLENPIIRKMVIAGLQPVLEPLVIKAIPGLPWHVFAPGLELVTELTRIEAIVAEPSRTFHELLEKGGPVCKVLIGMLAVKLQPLCEMEKMSWV